MNKNALFLATDFTDFTRFLATKRHKMHKRDKKMTKKVLYKHINSWIPA